MGTGNSGRPPDPNERSPRLGLKNKDLRVLEQLIKVGADLTRPRHVVYYLYFPSEHDARAALAGARQTGLHAAVHAPPNRNPDRWPLICQRNDIILSPDFVRGIDDQLQALADQYNGDYDGWEAAAQP